jgi:hypothetical protein
MNYLEALEEAGHVLERDEDGDVDTFAYEYGYHNGPVCVNCQRSWCVHCEDSFDFCIGKEAYDAKQRETRYQMYLKLKEEFE